MRRRKDYVMEYRYVLIEEAKTKESLDEAAIDFIDFYLFETWLYHRNNCPCCGGFLPKEFWS